MRVVCQNRKAFHDYAFDETVEAGLALLGTEVKSLREGKAHLKESYILLKGTESFLFNCHISPYSHGNITNHDPVRMRKLLLHRSEIERIRGKMQQKGYALIPLKIYFKGPFAKVEVGLGRGKRLYEKRDSVKEREARREIERAIKGKKEVRS